MLYETLFYIPLRNLLTLSCVSKTIETKLRNTSSAIIYHLKTEYYTEVETFNEALNSLKSLSTGSKFIYTFTYHTNDAFTFDLDAKVLTE